MKSFFETKASNYRGSRDGALGIVAELVETHALRDQPVKVRRLHFSTIANDVVKAHVIAHDRTHVRFRRTESRKHSR
jgi:hypothetical protein